MNFSKIAFAIDSNLFSSVSSITSTAFYGCFALEQFIVDESNQNYKSIDGVLFTKDGKTLHQYPHGNHREVYDVPIGTEIIESEAFGGCSSINSLKTIITYEGFNTIRSKSFYYCDSIESFIVKGYDLTVEYQGLNYAQNLKNFIVEGNVTSIGSSAFSNTKLSTIEYKGNNAPSCSSSSLPSSVTIYVTTKYPSDQMCS